MRKNLRLKNWKSLLKELGEFRLREKRLAAIRGVISRLYVRR